MKLQKAGLFLLLLLMLPACASRQPGLPPAPSHPHPAETLVQQLQQANPGLATFNGSGRLRVWHQGSPQSFRAAWIVAGPSHLRLVIRGINGMPLVTLAADEQWIYLRRHETHQLQQFKRGEADLSAILGIAVSVTDVVAFLGGRIPDYPYHRAAIQPHPAHDEIRLLLQRRWNRNLAVIDIEPSHTTPKQITYFDGAGALAYHLIFQGRQPDPDYAIPRRLTCRDAYDDGFELDIETFQAHIAIDPSVFTLHL